MSLKVPILHLERKRNQPVTHYDKGMRLRWISFAFTLALGAFSHAQLPQLFRAEFNGPANHADDGVCLAVGGLGAYVAGDMYSPVTATTDAGLVAYDQQGHVRWTWSDRTAGESEKATQLKTDHQGNVLLLTFVRTNTSAFLRLKKFTRTGLPLWQRELSRGTSVINFEEGALELDAQDNAYIGNARNGDWLVAKVAANGSVLWEKTIPDAAPWEEVHNLAADPSGGVVAVGTAGEIGGGYRTVKFDTNGNVVWTNMDPGPIGNTLGTAFVEHLSNGDFAVLTNPESTFGVPQYRVRAVRPDGTVRWQREYSPSPQNDCEATGMAVDANDNIIAAGFKLGGGSDSAVVKYDAAGNRLWEANYTPSSAASADVAVDDNGFVTLSGFLSAGTSSGLLVRYNPSGQQVWAKTAPSDRYSRLDVDTKNSVYVVGTVFNQSTNSDFVTLKYSWMGRAMPMP